MMINIEVKNKIKRIRTVSEPDEWKLLTLKEDEIDLPGHFFDGKKWTIYFNCSSCRKETRFGGFFQSPDYIAGGELHYHSFNDKKYLDLFGNLFNLDLIDEGVDVNNKTIFYYQIKNSAAWLDYFKCNHCNAQYLMASSKQYMGERPPKPDLIHIKGVYQVEFDEGEFFRLYNMYRVKTK